MLSVEIETQRESLICIFQKAKGNTAINCMYDGALYHGDLQFSLGIAKWNVCVTFFSVYHVQR